MEIQADFAVLIASTALVTASSASAAAFKTRSWDRVERAIASRAAVSAAAVAAF